MVWTKRFGGVSLIAMLCCISAGQADPRTDRPWSERVEYSATHGSFPPLSSGNQGCGPLLGGAAAALTIILLRCDRDETRGAHIALGIIGFGLQLVGAPGSPGHLPGTGV
jgi:hypothetical protein